MTKTAKLKISLLLSILFSLGVIIYVLYSLDWISVRNTLSQLSLGWLGLALLTYALNYVFRTLRFQVLLTTEEVSFWQLYAVTSLYGMYNYLLPAKSGEITFVALAKNRLNISLTLGASSLIFVRFFDFATIALFLPFVLVANLKTLPLWLVCASLIYIMAIIFVGLFLYFFLQREYAPKINPSTWRAKLDNLVLGFQEAAKDVLLQKKYIPLFLYTVFIWLCIYTNFYLLTLSLGYRFDYFQVVVISIIMIPMTLLPIQGFANLGTHEVGWITAFAIFNQPEQLGVTMAFSSHVLLLLFVLVLGALGLFLLFRSSLEFHEGAEK